MFEYTIKNVLKDRIDFLKIYPQNKDMEDIISELEQANQSIRKGRKKMIITICAFTDNQPNSVAYKKFADIEKAVNFYSKMLAREDVNVVSTRKIKEEDKDSFTMDKQSLENLKSIGGDETENYIYSMKRKEGKQ